MAKSVDKDENRTIEELVMRYELEPTLRDVYVEGAFDVVLVGEVLTQAGCHNAAVYEINTVNISTDIVNKHGLSDGNKGRVITLCLELDAHVPTPNQLTGLVDQDYDPVVGRSYGNRFLLFTDYCCMEMYLFEEAILERFCRMFVRRNGGMAAHILAMLTPVLQELFFIRAANEVLQLGLTWLEADKQCVVRDGVLKLDSNEFILKYLNKNSLATEKERFEKTVQSIREKASSDTRNQMNGHDFIHLLAKYLHTVVRNKKLADAEVIERSLLGYADYVHLRESSLFLTLVQRVSS